MKPEKKMNMKRSLVKYSQEGNYQKVDQLLADGADPTAYLSEPVRKAIANNDTQMVNLFLKNGYSPNTNNSIAFIEAIKMENTQIVKLLIEKETPSAAILGAAQKCKNSELKNMINNAFKNELIK